jgi:hypothetical protein
VSVDYLLPTGETLNKRYLVPALSRFTIWVDDEQIPAESGRRPLSNTPVSAIVASTNNVPIIVERSMWWPGPETSPHFWTEAHNSAGAMTTGTAWAVAGGEVGGQDSAETYVLIANTSDFGSQALVRLIFDDGSIKEKLIDIPARSRVSVKGSTDFNLTGENHFGVVVEPVGASQPQIVVEAAVYTSPGGQIWAAGTNVLGTRLR